MSARSVAESVAEIPRVAAQNTAGCASAALDYATRGWRVIPLHSPTAGGCSCGKTGCEHAGKHPRTKNGSKDGSSDPTTIREWWKLWPDANVGIVTGPESGFFVLDVDGEQGERSLADLEQRHGALPDTLTVHTSRGRHLCFRWEQGAEVRNSQSKIAPGLDIRGQGGFVVAPPSRHASGYPIPIRECRYADSAGARLAHSAVRGAGAAINRSDTRRALVHSSGQRTPALFRRGCSLRARGAEKEEIESDLLRMNRERCDPPHDQSKVRKIAEEICEQYTPRSLFGLTPLRPLSEFLLSACQENNLEFMQRNQRAKWRSPLFVFTRWVKGRPEFSDMDPSQAARRIEQELGVEFWERFAGGSVCADPRVQFIAEWDAVRSPAGTGGALALAWEEAQQTCLAPANSYSPQYANSYRCSLPCSVGRAKASDSLRLRS